MTWVSSIFDGQRDQQMSGTYVAPGGDSQTFASLLDPNDNHLDRDNSYARGFDELGLFGTRKAAGKGQGAAVSQPAGHNASNEVQSMDPSTKPDDKEILIGQTERPSPSMSITSSASGAAFGKTQAGSLDPSPLLALPASPSMQGRNLQFLDVQAGDKRLDRSSAAPAAAKATMPSSKLVVSGEATVIDVALRLPVQSADAELRLRRKIRELSAELGFEVANLHINGASTSPDFVRNTGALDGNCTR